MSGRSLRTWMRPGSGSLAGGYTGRVKGASVALSFLFISTESHVNRAGDTTSKAFCSAALPGPLRSSPGTGRTDAMYNTSLHGVLARSARRDVLRAAALSLLLLIPSPGATAQDAGRGERFAVGIEGEFRARSQEAAERRLAGAALAVRAMSANPAIADLLRRARGVYIVPAYGRAALGVGAAGGSGVLMSRHADGHWGNPAFFTMGGLGIGLQAGAEDGPIALLLMNQKAIDRFRKRNNFSLSADAGLTIVNYRRMTAGSTASDVIAWSGGKGVFGNAATVSVNNIRYNHDLTHAFYGKPVSAQQAIDGAAPDRRAHALRTALGEQTQAAPALDN